jgi:dihydrofolate reductase
MRKIITTTFVTLDGVMQAPGGPEEDVSGNFSYGGWMANFGDDKTDEVISGFMELEFDLLLGRRTYEIFAAYWPHAKSDSQIAAKFNQAAKYVVSHSEPELSWQNSKLITGDVPAELRTLKAETGPDLWVHGSGELIQTLLAEDLVDVLHVWTNPATIGNGKRLFARGTKPASFKLTQSKVSPSGVIIATYEPAGELKTGTVG